VLSEPSCIQGMQQLRFSHLHTGESIVLSGVFAERLAAHLATPETVPFPNLGPLLRRHHWLEQLQSTTPTPSQLLLGNGLGMLFIELTDRCNESCIHCYAESSPQRSARLSREEIRRVLEEASGLGRPVVQFTGGDPLLHPDLGFALQTAHALGLETLEVYTNGLALSETLLSTLLPHRPSFAFSVYSSEAAVHDAITQTPGSLSRTIKAMHRVRQAGLPMRVGIILMPENRDSEEATTAYLQQELGLDAADIGIDVVRSTGRGEYMHDAQASTSGRQHFRHRPDSPSEEQQSVPAQGKSITVRRGKLCISASGDVFPCIFSRRTRLGNIRNHALHDILTSLNQRTLSTPSTERWMHCRESLSCSDCQAIAYLLEDDAGHPQATIPILPRGANATT